MYRRLPLGLKPGEGAMPETRPLTAAESRTMARNKEMAMDDHDNDRLELLDRIEKRIPELDLDQQVIEWTTLPDGSVALLVNGGGIDGGTGAYFANAGEDLHVVGSVEPLIPGHVGCVVIRPDKTRVLARVEPDPLAGQKPD